jgi:hypothetical protein
MFAETEFCKPFRDVSKTAGHRALQSAIDLHNDQSCRIEQSELVTSISQARKYAQALTLFPSVLRAAWKLRVIPSHEGSEMDLRWAMKATPFCSVRLAVHGSMPMGPSSH